MIVQRLQGGGIDVQEEPVGDGTTRKVIVFTDQQANVVLIPLDQVACEDVARKLTSGITVARAMPLGVLEREV